MFNSKQIPQVTFEQMPNAISALLHEVEQLKELILNSLPVAKPTRGMLTVEETCSFLGMAKSTLYGKVQQREIAYSKLGKHLRFAMEDLIEYQKRKRKKTTSELQEEVRKGGRRG